MTDEPQMHVALDDDAMPELPGWPKPIGIISIVWGGVGLTCAGCGVVGSTLGPTLAKSAEAQMGPMPAAMQPGPTQQLLAFVGFLPPIILILAGVQTILRRPLGRPLHLVYAVIALVMTVIGTVVGLQQMEMLNAWARDNPENLWAQNHNPLVSYVLMGLGVIIGATWPLFCLVWFGLVKRSKDAMTGGVDLGVV